MSNGFTIESARESLAQFTKYMEQRVPNPVTSILIDVNHEYTMIELRSLLQQFSSHLATLCGIQGQVEAEYTLIKKGLKTGLDVASLSDESKSTITEKESRLIASNEEFAKWKKMEIYMEASLIQVKSWVKSYESAVAGVSRIVTVDISESSLVTNRYT